MAEFSVSASSSLSPAQAWARVTDWASHGEFVPLTTVRVTTDPPNGVGTVFVARTGTARAGFDDPMEVVRWEPPAGGTARGFCRLEKRGRVMLGWAEITVEAHGDGSRTTWHEDAHPAHVPGVADPLVALTSRLLFGRVLRKLVAA